MLCAGLAGYLARCSNSQWMQLLALEASANAPQRRRAAAPAVATNLLKERSAALHELVQQLQQCMQDTNAALFPKKLLHFV